MQKFLSSKELNSSAINNWPTSANEVLAMTQVTASWTDRSEEMTIRCDYMGLKKGQLGIVMGAVGSGKVFMNK